MKAHVDISVHAGNVSVGMAAGELDFPHLPRAGEWIDFAFAAVDGVLCPESTGTLSTRVQVESVSYSAGALAPGPYLHMEPAVVDSVGAGLELLEYFAAGFGLTADIFVEGPDDTARG